MVRGRLVLILLAYLCCLQILPCASGRPSYVAFEQVLRIRICLTLSFCQINGGPHSSEFILIGQTTRLAELRRMMSILMSFVS